MCAAYFAVRSIEVHLKTVRQSVGDLMGSYHQTLEFQTGEEKRSRELVILQISRAEWPSILES